MKVVVNRITIDKKKRIIAISDIHGNLDLFKKLLSKISYSDNDVLVLVGDLIEKGDKNLDTLRYIINLSKEKEVHVVIGNCDMLWRNVKYDLGDENLLNYMLFRENSILNEMCKELSIIVDKNSDIKFIKGELLKHFSEEFTFLEGLPHIIETEKYIFAHAGISSEDLEENEVKEVLKRDAFIDEGLTFSKYVIVGHWPTVNYGKDKGSCNPVINKEQKIISIDGGNTIKSDGQLNALIIDGDDITFDLADDLPKGEIIKDQEANTNTIQIVWADNLIERLEDGEEFSLCRHQSSGHELFIKNDSIFEIKGGLHCYDCTDYFIQAKKGDIVSIVDKTKNITLVKNNGVIGWVRNENLKES